MNKPKIPMKLYYVAYDYGHGQYEMIDGPFGVWIEADNVRNVLLNPCNDDKLVIVTQDITVSEV